VRPSSPAEAHEIVQRVAGREDPILQEDFYNSLCAAFTVDEVRAQLAVAELHLTVEHRGDRHMSVKGQIRE